MKIGVLSDLHFSHAPFPIQFLPDTLYVDAGDSDGPIWTDYLKKLAMASGASLMNVLGNHDFYRRSFPKPGQNQWSMVYRGLKIAGCTLWTDLTDPEDWETYRQNLIDSRVTYGLSREAYLAAYDSDAHFLLRESPDVVVTHHSPSMKSCHPKWGTHRMNFAFHQKTNALIDEIRPKLWIHGHTHDPSDYVHGPTRVVCNPRGYPGENPEYQIKFVEV